MDELSDNVASIPSLPPCTRRGLLATGVALSVAGLSNAHGEAKKRRNRRKSRRKRNTTGEEGRVIGPDWTHVVGGNGSILFYNRRTGAGLVGTLDGRGFTAVEQHADFAPGYNLVAGTPRGSVLFLRNQDGLGAAGTLQNGRWSFLNQYSGFATWDNAAASADTLFLYSRTRNGHGASGTLVGGAWHYLREYNDFYMDYTYFAATDDSMLFYQRNAPTKDSITGTLEGGYFTFAHSYNDIGNLPYVVDYHVAVGAGDTLLLLGFTNLNGATGHLVDGAWRFDHNYPGFAYWTHAAHAGNGFVLLYDEATGNAAWGTLGNGAWTYYGTT